MSSYIVSIETISHETKENAMKAAVVREWGETPVYTDFPEPQPTDSTVVAAVEASALTNLTRGIASGKHYASRELTPPVVPGVDGIVRLDDGRRFYTDATGSSGLMAERALVDLDTAVEVPEGVDSVVAAAVVNPGISAWSAVEYAAAVKPGDHVLVIGATGVTGSLALQLAKSKFGAAKVVAVGRDAERLAWLRTVGADDTITIDDLSERVGALHAERPFDAVLDYLWGEPAERTLTALADSHPAAYYHATRYVEIGSMAGMTINLPAKVLRSSGITLSGVGIGSIPPEVLARARSEALPQLFPLVSAGELKLTTLARPLADVAQAWTSKEPSGTRIVLTP
jgi:NADPH:quinone reductase-like Zn-dependent oxidoreductase